MPGVLVKGKYEDRGVFEHRGIQCRKGTYDAYIVNEIPRSYGMLDVKGKVVFDIGANIGAYSLLALNMGADTVIAFEPEPNNFEMLQLNNSRLEGSYITHKIALITGDDKDIDLWIAPSGKNPGNSSLIQRRGRIPVKVATGNFYYMLEQYKPEVIKMDVEGAEYDLLAHGLPDHVRQIAMEIHLQGKMPNFFQCAPYMITQFKDWECIKEPVLDNPKLWQTLGAWKR